MRWLRSPRCSAPDGRPGGLFESSGRPTEIAAQDILSQILASLSGIWLAANRIGHEALGDCWRHDAVPGPGLTHGWVPFHKLSQWLTYSLLEPFEWAGVTCGGPGRADRPARISQRRPAAGHRACCGCATRRGPRAPGQSGDELVVEWRALTVALLDELAPLVRARLGVDAERMPLACVLEGGYLGGGPCARCSGCAAGVHRCPSPATARSSRKPWPTYISIDHPLVQHKLTLMRRKDASTNSFRRLLHEISALMAYEVLRDMPMHDIEIETPLERTTGKVIDGKKLVFVSILRAGTGILDGMLTVVPGARVGHIGLYRDPKTLVAVEYYFKMPGELHERDVVVVDPMLATGNSAVAAVDRLKEAGPSRSSSSAC